MSNNNRTLGLPPQITCDRTRRQLRYIPAPRPRHWAFLYCSFGAVALELNMSQAQAAMEPHYDLREAAARFFPGGRITRDKLKYQIRQGRLHAELICGQYFVTALAFLQMCQAHERNASTSPAADTANEPDMAQPAGGQHG